MPRLFYPFIAAAALACLSTPAWAGFTDAEYAEHIKKLRERLPHKNFTVVVEKPFVVVGDEAAATVRRRAVGTVRWATRHLKQRYFAKDPQRILTIWLFKNKTSYETHAKALFGSKPSTPYGYYSPWHRALVMNIATGGGTLVHEMVHPFVEANFPDCPAWFNEGLGSLYEQCAERNGRIVGLTNWRLAGLQKAIDKETTPSFKTLCATTSKQFYDGASRGTNYAQARYLLYYLQETGRLQMFYKTFTANAAKDPTGYKSLMAVLGKDARQMAAFQKTWEAYVLKLRYR